MKSLEGKYYIADYGTSYLLAASIGVRIIEVSEIAKVMYVERTHYTMDYLRGDLITGEKFYSVEVLDRINKLYVSEELMTEELIAMRMKQYKYKLEESNYRKDREEKEKKEEKRKDSWWPF